MENNRNMELYYPGGIENNRQMELYSHGCMENNKQIKLYFPMLYRKWQTIGAVSPWVYGK
jgi:hypothetical protein